MSYDALNCWIDSELSQALAKSVTNKQNFLKHMVSTLNKLEFQWNKAAQFACRLWIYIFIYWLLSHCAHMVILRPLAMLFKQLLHKLNVLVHCILPENIWSNQKNWFCMEKCINTSMVSWFSKSFLLKYYTTTLSQATLSFPDTLLSLYSVLTLSKINTHFVMPFLLFQLSHLAFPFRSSMPGRAVLQSPSEAWVAMVTITDGHHSDDH